MNSFNYGQYNKFSEATKTCYGKKYENPIYGFYNQFQDSFFYANVIQFIVVTLIYMNVGKGRYWNVLLFASISGFLGALIENFTVAFICSYNEKDNSKKVITFLLNEIFWIVCQFSVPFLNLIKMKSFSRGRLAIVIKYTIYVLFIIFIFLRVTIGIKRMKRGYLFDEEINAYHGYAFAVLAIADFICTISVLYFVRKHNKQLAYNTSSISDYIKNSSYTILVIVDTVGFSLILLEIIINYKIMEIIIPPTIIIPFHCIISNFILILAIDALLFKYCTKDASNSSIEKSNKYLFNNYMYSSKHNNDKFWKYNKTNNNLDSYFINMKKYNHLLPKKKNYKNYKAQY